MMRGKIKIKNIIAGTVLSLIAVFSIAPTVDAGHTAYGSRLSVNGGYYSWTRAEGYASNGVGYNLRAYSQIGTYTNTGSGVGAAEAIAGREITAKNAIHKYFVGDTLIKKWTQN